MKAIQDLHKTEQPPPKDEVFAEMFHITRVRVRIGEDMRELTMEQAKSLLRCLTSAMLNDGAIEPILNKVCAEFGVSKAQVFSPSRKEPIVRARQVVMYLARRLTVWPLERIGALFAKDHGTVLHAIGCIKDFMEVYPTWKAHMERLESEIGVLPMLDAPLSALPLSLPKRREVNGVIRW